jgi:hypothetical protein
MSTVNGLLEFRRGYARTPRRRKGIFVETANVSRHESGMEWATGELQQTPPSCMELGRDGGAL